MYDIAVRQFDQTSERYICEFIKMDLPDPMSGVRIAPLVWKFGDWDGGVDTQWGSITLALEYVDSRDPTEEEIAQAEAGDWNQAPPEELILEVDRIVNEPISPYPTYIDNEGKQRYLIDHMPYNEGLPSRPLMELIEDSFDDPAVYRTLKFRIDSTPFGLRKAYMAIAYRSEKVSTADNDRLTMRFKDAFFAAELAWHYSRPLTRFDHFIGFDYGPPEPETNLRLDFEKVPVRNIADTLLIELPEFWRIEQASDETWRYFQPDLSDKDDWGECIITLAFIAAPEEETQPHPRGRAASRLSPNGGHKIGLRGRRSGNGTCISSATHSPCPQLSERGMRVRDHRVGCGARLDGVLPNQAPTASSLFALSHPDIPGLAQAWA